MDPVTHTLAGVALANAFFRERVPRAVPVLAVAANLPDVDALAMLLGPDGVLHRRTAGHSALMIPLWAAGLTWLLRKRWPELPSRPVFGLCLVGSVLHVFLDLINSFGVVPLWPFSDWRPELSIVFILDLVLTAILAAPLLLSRVDRWAPRAATIWRGALATAAVYLMVCGTAHGLALLKLADEAARLGVRPDLLYAFPEPLGPHRWRGVVRAGGIYRVYLVDVLAGSAEPWGELETMTGDARVRRARETERGRRVDWFFKAPVWTVRTGDADAEVTAEDLRFASLVLPRQNPFRFSFPGVTGVAGD